MTKAKSRGAGASSYFALLVFVSIAINHAFADARTDLIFKVLTDELDRNMSQLVMENLERPYFIRYTIDEIQQLEVTAGLGSLISSNLEHGRYLTTDLRVGDWSLDNSNFSGGGGMFGFNFSYTTLPLADDYDALRHQIYLNTDAQYKAALETVSKKRAYLQTRVTTEHIDDHIKLPANKFLDKPEVFDIDQRFFEDLARPMTAIFRNYPQIISSEVKITASVANQYFANSIGTRVLRGDRIYGVDLKMAGRTATGEDISGADRLIVNDLKQLPDRDQLVAWAKGNAERMSRMIAADTVDDYIGPVLFTGDAAGELLRQLFVKNISNLPAPMTENDQFADMMDRSEFGNKLHRRILPLSFNVYNDPTLTALGDKQLIGAYPVDDVGGPAKRTQLVENGKLVSFLIGTTPTKKVKEPTGSARGAVGSDITAKPANTIFESSDWYSFEQLKEQMIALCHDIDLPYGLIVRRLDDFSAPAGMMRFMQMTGQRGGNDGGLSRPLEIYKVYADGREEPVRGLVFAGVTSRLLRDIIATDNSRHIYNYVIGNDFEMPACIVTPSLLIEEMELKSQEAKVKKPPILPSPLAEQ